MPPQSPCRTRFTSINAAIGETRGSRAISGTTVNSGGKKQATKAIKLIDCLCRHCNPFLPGSCSTAERRMLAGKALFPRLGMVSKGSCRAELWHRGGHGAGKRFWGKESAIPGDPISMQELREAAPGSRTLRKHGSTW